jgi:hypothetical protein
MPRRRGRGARSPTAISVHHSVPPGFHEEQRPIYPVLVTGAVITVMGALLVGTGAAIASARVGAPTQRAHEESQDNAFVFTTLGLAHLGVGLPLLTLGLLARCAVYVQDRAANLSPSTQQMKKALRMLDPQGLLDGRLRLYLRAAASLASFSR